MVYRSGCPMCNALDIVGDKWSLIVIRDLVQLMKELTSEDLYSTLPLRNSSAEGNSIDPPLRTILSNKVGGLFGE